MTTQQINLAQELSTLTPAQVAESHGRILGFNPLTSAEIDYSNYRATLMPGDKEESDFVVYDILKSLVDEGSYQLYIDAYEVAGYSGFMSVACQRKKAAPPH